MPGPLAQLRRRVRGGRSDAPGPVVDLLGRVGLVGYGVVHLIVAWLALQVASGVPDAAPDAEGAVATVAGTRGGRPALVLAAVCLLAFALWQLTAAAVGFRWVEGGERVRKRVGAVAKAIAVLGLTAAVASFLAGTGAQDSTTRVVAADVLALPGGRVLLGLGAGTILAIAVSMTYTGLARTFMGDLDVDRLGPATRRAVEVAGTAGHLARALAVGVVGVLAGTAALFADPARAGGLDAALRALAGTAPGAGLLVVVAIGFAAFGLFCFADAAVRRA